jgi:hypothetical protein
LHSTVFIHCSRWITQRRVGDESLMIHKQLKLRQNVTLFRWLPLRSGDGIAYWRRVH